MIGFTGEFEVNFSLPDYIGLGKSVSRGFGTVVQSTEHRGQRTEGRRQRMKQKEIIKLTRMDDQLLANIKARLPELEKLMEEMSSHWCYEDPIYRFYYHSFKVYDLQNKTKKIVEALKSMAPKGQNFCKEFQEIIDSGASGKKFELLHNENWAYHTRVFVEAFFHAKFFLEMAIKYGKELKKAPDMLPSGWAALLCLYNLR